MIFPNQTLWVKSYITIMNLKLSRYRMIHDELFELWNQTLRKLIHYFIVQPEQNGQWLKNLKTKIPYSFNVPDELAHLTWWILKIRNENPCTFGTSIRAPGLLEQAKHWENTNLFQNISSRNYYKTYWIFHEFDQNTPQFSRKIRNAEKLQWINSTKLLQQIHLKI